MYLTCNPTHYLYPTPIATVSTMAATRSLYRKGGTVVDKLPTLGPTSAFVRSSQAIRHDRSPAVLDFLLPSSVGVRQRALAHARSYDCGRRNLVAPTHSRHLQRRPCSSSQKKQAVVVAANPRKDENGNEMVVDITTRAATVIINFLQSS